MPAHHSILLYLSIALAVLYLLGTVAQQNSVDFRDVELVTQDGASLSVWFMRPQEANGNVVILLHGISDNRLGM